MAGERFKALPWVGILVFLVAVIALWLTKGSDRSSRLDAAVVDNNDLRCLALTLYWEAREDDRQGMQAVGWVVLNRRKHAEFPDTICEVVRQGGQTPPCQFSYWCDGEPETPRNADAWKRAREVAGRMLEDPPADPTQGALFFHSVEIPPPWTEDRKRIARIGRHVFYR